MEAQYEILVPSGRIGQAAARYLHGQLNVPVHVQSRMVVMDGQPQDYDVVQANVEDTPSTDSHVKQTASYVAEVAGLETVIVSKNGKNGIQTWPIRNTAPSTSMTTSAP